MDSYLNSDTEISLRRYRDNLAGSGTGYILFGIWTVIKIFMTATMNRSFIASILADINIDTSDEFSRRIMFIVVYSVLFLIALIALLVHLYIGTSALRYSSGKKKSKLFLACCIVLILLGISTIPSYFTVSEGASAAYEDKGIVPTIVDLTVIYLLFDIVYSVHKIDALTQKKPNGTPADPAEDDKTGE